ncbi:alpha/beta fold hydrolase [Microbaculum marinum]|uniref:Alpha/beta fold hydrolase n=1 Tax=Microbaculum marinum TaxID=1764581 RepID=A0AAW9RMU5_9HYPH
MIYRFANCEIDTLRHRLRVDGVEKSVEPQVFDLLRHMAENPGRLISHDELIDVVWQGRAVSDSAVSVRISAARSALGDDGTRQAVIRTVPRRGFQLLPAVETVPDDTQPPPAGKDSAREAPAAGRPGDQVVRVCTSADGTRIAYATSGAGYPLVRAGHWLTHLEHDWNSPIWRPFLDALGSRFRVTRYDQRGNGLSDWSVEGFALDDLVDDLAAVADAAGLERFALFGSSQGVPVSIAYAVRHPERVSHLVLHGGFVVGRLLRSDVGEREKGQALLTLIRHSWGQPGSAFIKSFASMFIPDGTSEQLDSLAELQRLTTSPENAARLRAAIDSFDVAALLPQVRVPTLVVHARNDSVQPLDEGRRLAAGIPGAEFLLLDSGNHVVLEQEPAWDVLFRRLDAFLPSASRDA